MFAAAWKKSKQPQKTIPYWRLSKAAGLVEFITIIDREVLSVNLVIVLIAIGIWLYVQQ